MNSFFPFPEDEIERLATLERLRIVGTPPSPDFDAILALALDITRCRSGLIGFIDQDRHWLKAQRNVTSSDLPRALSLGNHTLLQSEPLIVEDLTCDARFRDNPFVIERGVRFYAGIALAYGGFNVGTLCLADPRPQAAPPDLVNTLTRLGGVVEALMATHARAVEATALARTAEARGREIWKKTRLIAQSERLAKVGAWEIDLASNTLEMSEETYRIHDIEAGFVPSIAEFRSRLTPEVRARADQLFQTCLKTGQGYEYKGEMVSRSGKRRYAHVIAEAERQDDRVVRIFGTIRDVTEEHEAEQALWRAAHYDALTEAPNRHFWSTRLDQAVARAVAGQTGLSILMFDLDGFKEINDSRGHAVGDAVLRDVARRLGETLPDTAFHARLGGDEFAVLLEGTLTQEEVESHMQALLGAIQRPIFVDALWLQVSGTFGSASLPADASTAADLMQKADIALYQAKRSHRSSFVSFRAEIGDLFHDKRFALDLVAAAIEQKRLVPFYQPKVDLKTGQIRGFEALCRIEAADGTILGPSQFLPALQDPASSARIGVAMLDLVTADIAAWHAEDLAPGRIALNVTGSDFADGHLDHRILSRLATLGLPTTALEVEVTENTILGKEALVVGAALEALHQKGVIIALDDFGTGYASLTHLRDAPIRYIKLDRSFIAGLGRGVDSAIIVRSVVDLGHSLGMKVVAEGIETKAQAEFLRAIGCDEAQGFLYGRPASSQATRANLVEARHAMQRAKPAHHGVLNVLMRRSGA